MFPEKRWQLTDWTTSSIKREYFNDSSLHTKCPWKGQSSYYNLNIDGELRLNPPTPSLDEATDPSSIAGKEFKDAAWYYPEPFEKATHIKDHVAFDKRQVETTKS